MIQNTWWPNLICVVWRLRSRMSVYSGLPGTVPICMCRSVELLIGDPCHSQKCPSEDNNYMGIQTIKSNYLNSGEERSGSGIWNSCQPQREVLACKRHTVAHEAGLHLRAQASLRGQAQPLWPGWALEGNAAAPSQTSLPLHPPPPLFPSLNNISGNERLRERFSTGGKGKNKHPDEFSMFKCTFYVQFLFPRREVDELAERNRICKLWAWLRSRIGR